MKKGVILHPNQATNVNSGNCIDYFLVRVSLRAAVRCVEVHFDGHFSPHLSASITLEGTACVGEDIRMSYFNKALAILVYNTARTLCAPASSPHY